MADLNDDSLKNLLGDDPIATSVSVRIRQDEQTLTNLERRFNSIKKEAEGIVKALKEAGVHANNLGGTGGGKSGKASSTIGSTPVAGATFTPTPIDRGRGTVTGMAPGGQTSTSGGGGGNFFTRAYQAVQPGPGGQPTEGSVRMATGMETLNAVLNSSDARINRGYAYSLPADRMNMLYQQMKGMSQQAIQDTYRQPLAGRMLGQGGINAMLALEASTGISAAQQARSVEALRISSGFSVNAQQAASTLEQLASPQVANRMFMMTGMSLVKPGGGHRSLDEVMRHLVKTQGLTDPRILQGAKAQGSVTRNNLTNIGITGDLQTQLIQYAEQNLAYKQKGGTGMYDPTNREHQKTMGIDKNFAMEKERTTQLEIEREEKFYSRQADNFADLERQTQSLVRVLGALEDKLSGLFGLRISTQVGAKAGQSIGSAFLGPLGGAIGKGLGTITGLFNMGDFVSADQAERNASKGGTTFRASTPFNAGKSGIAGPSTFRSNSSFRSTATTSAATPAARVLTPSQAASANAKRSSITASGMGSGRLAPEGAQINDFFMSGKTGQIGSDGKPMQWAWDGWRNQDFIKEVRMAFTRLNVFGDGPMSLADLQKHHKFSNLEPEFKNNLIEMFLAADAEGVKLGLTSGYRSYQDQYNLFTSRYSQVGYKTSDDAVQWNGSWWDKDNPSDDDVAPPGSSYANHEHGLAADLHGDLEWVKKNAARFGLQSFADINDEPHHVQPAGLKGAKGGGPAWNQERGFTVPGFTRDTPAEALESTLYDAGLKSVRWDTGTNNASGVASSVTGSRPRGLSNFGMTERGLERRAQSGIVPKSMVGPSGKLIQGDRVDPKEVAKILHSRGYSGDAIVQFLSIMGRESGGEYMANRVNSSENSKGLFQINTLSKNAEQNRIDWGLQSFDDLYDPMSNIDVAMQFYDWYGDNGYASPFHAWGGYKAKELGLDPSVAHMYNTQGHFDKALNITKELGYIKSYSGPMPQKRQGDYVGKKSSRSTYESRNGFNSGGYSGVSSLGSTTQMSSASTTALVGGTNITVAPTINITASGGNLDQDLEKMARKVAMMLEREVNRTMMRRT